MDILDTRDLAEKREELKQQILEDFLENFPQYEEMTESYEDIRFEEEELENWFDDWYKEKEEIEEIDQIERECSEFKHGEALINQTDFTFYCEELCEDIGYISKDLPHWIEIDWYATADNMKADYSECEYCGETYLYRS